jgi:dTDP-4-dehydrorhamnose 3,5-epimerase
VLNPAIKINETLTMSLLTQSTEGWIEGVKVCSLKLLPNEKGRLMEIQREDDVIFPGFGQTYITSTFPGIIKAWYRHEKQIDQIAVIVGTLKLVLYDDRENSPSYGQINTIFLGELAPKLVQIPPAIWHGFQAIGTQEAFAVHLNSVAFQADAPDEDRLPFNTNLIPYHW